MQKRKSTICFTYEKINSILNVKETLLYFISLFFPLFQTSYFSTFRQVYTTGYATSLISLISAIFVFTAFRYNKYSGNLDICVFIYINLIQNALYKLTSFVNTYILHIFTCIYWWVILCITKTRFNPFIQPFFHSIIQSFNQSFIHSSSVESLSWSGLSIHTHSHTHSLLRAI